MDITHAPLSTRLKVGIFSLTGLLLIGLVTVLVNDRPYWWRPCNLVHISIEDATGLKKKSPVRSLGLEIGYLRSVTLSETRVDLGICITAEVEVIPATRAYIRGEGFLGDKFVELKPVKYTGPREMEEGEGAREPPKSTSLWNLFVLPEARAEESGGHSGTVTEEPSPSEEKAPETVPVPAPSPAPKRKGRQIPVGEKSQDVQQVVNQVDVLVKEMTSLTNNLKQAIHPEELRQTMRQLNKTLENASKTLSPEGGLNTTAQRTLAKLEDAIEQLRDMITRMNKGEGSVGMLINDPSYAEEIKSAVKNLNQLLSKVSDVRFNVDMGGEQITAYDGGRGWFKLGIWPQRDRYYLLGVSIDPRGRRTVVRTTTVAGGQTTSTETTQIEPSGLLFTAMMGKVFWNRAELALGVLHSDGTGSAAVRLGPGGREDLVDVRVDLYSRGQGTGVDGRIGVTLRPWYTLYLRAGLEGVRQVEGKIPLFYGAGLSFDDSDIKLLFAFAGAR